MDLDVQTAFEEDLLHCDDEKIARVARSESRLIFTLDLDFSDVRKYEPGTHPGIILFRPPRMGPEFVERYVTKFVEENDVSNFEECLAVVDPDRIRVREPEND